VNTTATKISRELGWKPAETFETGIRKTVQWYLDNQAWVKNVTSGVYKMWINIQGSYVVDGVLMGYKSLISNEEQIFKRCARF